MTAQVFRMSMPRSFFAIAVVGFTLGSVGWNVTAEATTVPKEAPMTLVFGGGTDYIHRWSKGGQNEFTPSGQEDLAKWTDMVTINVHDTVTDGDQLANVANTVLTNYEGAGGYVIRTDSKPLTPERSAEHLVVAVLGNPEYLEAAFARFVLHEGVGFVIVYSHRVYGEAGAEMDKWLQSNGTSVEEMLMAWNGIPTMKALKGLPQSN